MKEQTLIEMKNKIQSLTNIMQQLLNEINHLRELGIGTLETVKLLPGYDDAIEKLKSNVLEKKQEREDKKLEV